jgi:hypothetical protein
MQVLVAAGGSSQLYLGPRYTYTRPPHVALLTCCADRRARVPWYNYRTSIYS